MSEFDEPGRRFRAVADESRQVGPGTTVEDLIARGPRRPGGQVAVRHRLALAASAFGGSLARLVRSPAPAARRVAVVAFVAVLIAAGTFGVLAGGRQATGRHSSRGSPTTTVVVSTTGTSSSTTTVTSTSAPVAGGSTTTVAPATSTTTTVPASPTLAGYRQVSNTASTTCLNGGATGSSPPPCDNSLSTTTTAGCPAGTKVLGGGASASFSDHNNPSLAAFVQGSYPVADGSGWTATAELSNPGNSAGRTSQKTPTLTVVAYAICGDVSS